MKINGININISKRATELLISGSAGIIAGALFTYIPFKKKIEQKVWRQAAGNIEGLMYDITRASDRAYNALSRLEHSTDELYKAANDYDNSSFYAALESGKTTKN